MAATTNKRTAHRWRLSAMIGAGLAFALGSFYMLQVMNVADMDMQAAQSDQPDYIVENFSFVGMTADGKPRYTVAGKRLSHRPLDDTALVEAPVVQSFSPNGAPTRMQSQRARVYNAEDRVDLLGKVTIERAGSPQGRRLSMRTETLTVLPDEDLMQTAAPVEMTIGTTTVRGVGMSANNATRQLHIAHKAEIVLPPNR